MKKIQCEYLSEVYSNYGQAAFEAERDFIEALRAWLRSDPESLELGDIVIDKESLAETWERYHGGTKSYRAFCWERYVAARDKRDDYWKRLMYQLKIPYLN